MLIKLLIASSDVSYAEQLSSVLSDRHERIFEVSLCSSEQSISDAISNGYYDVYLYENEFVSFIDHDKIQLSIRLDGDNELLSDGMKSISKYQRISIIISNILQLYAEINENNNKNSKVKARIIAVWSPCGGVGKTTVSLAYAARQVSKNKQVLYLNVENFSSIPVYFQSLGKSISSAFEKMNSNLETYLLGIRQCDSGSGIYYYNEPSNYDDINILTTDEYEILINACAVSTDEIIVDLSSQCDEKVIRVFEIADTVLLVGDSSNASKTKMLQFLNQNNIAHRIKDKCILVNNKGSRFTDSPITKIVHLPIVQSNDPISVYKTLSGCTIEG